MIFYKLLLSSYSLCHPILSFYTFLVVLFYLHLDFIHLSLNFLCSLFSLTLSLACYESVDGQLSASIDVIEVSGK